MNFLILQSAVEQGLLYGLVALGLYVSYRTLDIADLTTDSSFTLGCACSAVFTLMGHPLLGIGIAMLAGALAGSVTALLQTKLGVQPILAGIITMTALYSINLMVMGGKPNLPMLKAKNVYAMFEGVFGSFSKLAGCLLFAALAGVLLVLFLRTQLGLSLRATGDNRAMVAASSINPAFTTTLGLCISNALVALSGALVAQYQKFADISLGSGMVVIGLASLIIGEVVIGRGGIVRGVLGALLGAVIYRIIIALALTSNVDASNLKLVSAVIVAAAIAYPAVREKIAFYKLRKAGGKHVDG